MLVRKVILCFLLILATEVFYECTGRQERKGPPDIIAELNRVIKIKIKINQRAVFRKEGLGIKFLSVVKDKR